MNNRSYWRRALLGLQTLDVLPTSVRLRLLRAAGAIIHPSAFIEAGVEMVAGRLKIGARSYINRGCLLDARGDITIGAQTLVAPRVTILTATHPIMPNYPRAGPVEYEPVKIGANAWIGACVTILPGTEIGEGCVVAAGALARGKLEANALYAGVPAKRKRLLDGPLDAASAARLAREFAEA